MQQEIEVKFLDVDHEEMRARLIKAGATCKQPMRLMRRAILDYPDRRLQTGTGAGWGWVRIRDEGDRVTCTYKYINADGHDTTHEIEFTVSSYGKAVELFEAIGLTVHSEQETKRESWQLKDVSVELDEWPWIPQYLEIEGPSEIKIKAAAETLGFQWKDAVRGSSDRAYRIYYPKMTEDESISTIKNLTFSGTIPEWLESRR